MAIGAYSHAFLLSQGVPFLFSLPIAALTSGVVAMIAIPASRMTGLYLTIASLAFAIVVEDVIIHWESVTGGNRGMLVDTPILFGYEIFEAWEYYYIVLVLLKAAAGTEYLRSPLGRSAGRARQRNFAESLGPRSAYQSFGISNFGLFAHFIQFLSPKPSALFCRFSFCSWLW